MKALLGWLGWIAALAAGGLAWQLQQLPPVAVEIAPPAPAVADREAPAEAPAEEPAGGIEVVRALLLRVGELDEEVARARSERDRCMAGLERAVAQLNAQARTLSLISRESAGARPSGRASRPGRRRSSVKVRRPWLSVGSGEAHVAGVLYNGGSEPVAGYLEIKLLRDGRVQGSRTLAMEVGGRTEAPYETTFAPVAVGPSYSVRVEWGGR